MTREIKFRAWSTSQKIMYRRVCIGNTKTDDPCSIVYHEKTKDWLNFDKGCGYIMQFTGLTDKDGKDIYEGDVVKQFGSYIYEVKFGLYNNEMSFEDNISGNGWYLENFNLGYSHMMDRCVNGSELEVMGNIYENSELLNN